MIVIVPNFHDLRWELHDRRGFGDSTLIGFHKRSDVCDHWAEFHRKNGEVDHRIEFRAEEMAVMEQMRAKKKAK